VLTLSAVTGSRFDASAKKHAVFKNQPPANQLVSSDDLLVCRGNGNKHMVGRGFFPNERLPDVVFPDTIIAAKIDTSKSSTSFVERLWNSPAVRNQLEVSARTTNGTFKVNQAALESVELIAPPLATQRSYSVVSAFLDKEAKIAMQSLKHLDFLFASLQHRAFRGEL
jgi:type I restriction enzyme, S subunit